MKVFFFDVDGTLLPSYHQTVPPETIKALEELRRRGNKIVLCTGRGKEELNFTDYKFDGYILLNGQFCVDDKMEPYYVNPITGNDLQELIRVFQERNIPVVLTEANRVYMNFHNDYVRTVSKEISIAPHPVGEYTGSEIYMATVYAHEQMRIGALKADRWHSWAFDAYPDGGGKARGMKEFCQKYRIDIRDTIAFGDAENDVEMIRQAGLGIAMGNAYESVKEAADYVTTDAAENGIINALGHFELL